jgi:methylenetetrahydrofolate dehydrogenase (NADP+)/methenyltetrahydrofolate cyclohydrolase
MSAKILDGKAISARIKGEIKSQVTEMKKRGLVPGLAVVLVGDDPASQVYVGSKEKTSLDLGLYSEVHRLPAQTSLADLLALIRRLAEDRKVHGILVQSPLPRHLDFNTVLDAVPPSKDVDGLHPANAGRLMNGLKCFVSCTPLGCMELLKETGVNPAGLNAVVVGRSNLVGKPVAQLLLNANATVTVCHSKTKDLPAVIRQADIVVAAVGKARMITADMVKPGAVVLDVGINRQPDGKLVGDVDYAPVAEKASWITPVPGGVGPMTIAMLMKNTLQAAEEAGA